MTPGKGGQAVEGIPVFNTFHDAVAGTGAHGDDLRSPRFAADSILEAEDAGVELIIAITEGIPAHDELRVYNTLRAARHLAVPNGSVGATMHDPSDSRTPSTGYRMPPAIQ